MNIHWFRRWLFIEKLKHLLRIDEAISLKAVRLLSEQDEKADYAYSTWKIHLNFAGNLWIRLLMLVHGPRMFFFFLSMKVN